MFKPAKAIYILTATSIGKPLPQNFYYSMTKYYKPDLYV